MKIFEQPIVRNDQQFSSKIIIFSDTISLIKIQS
jgi:hypothetical protein